MTRSRERDKVSEQVRRETGRGRAAEAGARAGARIRGQRELWHQQQSTFNLTHAAIHPAFVVGEDAEGQQLAKQCLGLRVLVTALGTQKHDQPRPDCADHLSSNAYRAARDALKQRNHLSALTSVQAINSGAHLKRSAQAFSSQ